MPRLKKYTEDEPDRFSVWVWRGGMWRQHVSNAYIDMAGGGRVRRACEWIWGNAVRRAYDHGARRGLRTQIRNKIGVVVREIIPASASNTAGTTPTSIRVPRAGGGAPSCSAAPAAPSPAGAGSDGSS